ncbi:DUF2975 domain-containing protein [Candidatus Dojkabacteria bacterium]|uniref:DUF2975 domain-containing protein n=1 Tax=Candidatus Dojkabacteria bacterium TaxID=2099670 RepID=A0A5C7J6D8_9BACT|nr:MAG: DUF2975 domain-containing protein [Candidatus Dojkabacteria bacterium]
MDKSSTLFLRLVLILIAVIAGAVCAFVLPAGIASDNTGYYKPILLWLYLPAIPFFVALIQSFKLLNLIDKNKAFSEKSVNSLRIIKYCGLVISAIFLAGMPMVYFAAEKDDAPGVILVGLVFVFASFVVATFAGVLQKLLQNALEIKSENDLTV